MGQDLSFSGTGELADCPHQLCSLLWAVPTMTHTRNSEGSTCFFLYPKPKVVF